MYYSVDIHLLDQDQKPRQGQRKFCNLLFWSNEEWWALRRLGHACSCPDPCSSRGCSRVSALCTVRLTHTHTVYLLPSSSFPFISLFLPPFPFYFFLPLSLLSLLIPSSFISPYSFLLFPFISPYSFLLFPFIFPYSFLVSFYLSFSGESSLVVRRCV